MITAGAELREDLVARIVYLCMNASMGTQEAYSEQVYKLPFESFSLAGERFCCAQQLSLYRPLSFGRTCYLCVPQTADRLLTPEYDRSRD